MQPNCPICEKAVAPRGENSDFPFCSDRCRRIDLGQWLNESYRVPAPMGDPEEIAAALEEEASED